MSSVRIMITAFDEYNVELKLEVSAEVRLLYVCMYVRSEILAYVSSECHRGPSHHAGVVPKFDSQVRSSHPSS